MRLFSLMLLMLCYMWASAQNWLSFSSQNYIGLLEGQHGSSMQLQTINGARLKSWFGGLGTGIDWYYQRSIPIFLSVNKDFGKVRDRNFFAAANGGVSFPWMTDNINKEFGYTIDKTTPGAYWSLGMGYKIPVGKNDDAILLQVAYSYKHIREHVAGSFYPTDVFPSLTDDLTNRIDYYLHQFAFKIGWNFE